MRFIQAWEPPKEPVNWFEVPTEDIAFMLASRDTRDIPFAQRLSDAFTFLRESWLLP